MKLGRSTKLDGAVINDEVSHRVLSFAAPVLDSATRVEGRVSSDYPTRPFPSRAIPKLEGQAKGEVIFDDVRFMPGGLADQFLSVFVKERKPLVVLNDRCSVLISGRKVYQEGLVVPVGELATIGIDGSVDFDRSLDLVARFALNPRGRRCPCSRRSSKPHGSNCRSRHTQESQDRWSGMQDRWKAIASGLQGNSMGAGVNGLQKLLQGLSAPIRQGLRPPGNPPSPEDRQRKQEERRRERLQKKADRQLKRSLPAE